MLIGCATTGTFLSLIFSSSLSCNLLHYEGREREREREKACESKLLIYAENTFSIRHRVAWTQWSVSLPSGTKVKNIFLSVKEQKREDVLLFEEEKEIF